MGEENLASSENILGDEDFQTHLNVVSGLIRDDESQRLLKLLYRVSRGKVAAFFKEVGANQYDAAVNQDESRKTVFVLVFEDNKMLEERVLKICQSFTNHTYVMPKGFTRQLRY